jgi:hypothetical protein
MLFPLRDTGFVALDEAAYVVKVRIHTHVAGTYAAPLSDQGLETEASTVPKHQQQRDIVTVREVNMRNSFADVKLFSLLAKNIRVLLLSPD